ncbi:MAG TPA: LTA synthase family protein [Usitatibacter sp.]|nr:LTA synthase family protein [Usitatibacter sp.]
MTRRIMAASGWMLPALAIVIALMGYRVHLVDAAYGRYTGCLGCLDASVWANDGYLGAAFVAMFALSRLTGQRLVRAVLAAIVAGSAIAYGLDVLVFRLLAQRLLTVDLLHYGGEGSNLVSVLEPLLSHAEGCLLLAGIVAMAGFAAIAILSGAPRRDAAAVWGVVCVGILAASSGVHRPVYVHPEALRNVVQVNLGADPSRPYGHDMWLALQRRPAPERSCAAGIDRDVPVILLVVESLSAYHSKLFSGLGDDTPNLDRLARANTYFPGFNANGFSTEGGLIALLTGHVPLPTAGRSGSVLAFTDVEGDFHRELRREGYLTAFFTTGDLHFGERARWLPAIGIQHMEGAEQPFYAGMPRGPFDAASDAALFDRFLQWYDDERPARAFMATLLTVQTHPPYVAKNGESDEDARFREADRQIGRFVDALVKRGYFREGLLLISGDHRAMTPLDAHEEAVMGAGAAMRVPLVAIGPSAFVPHGRQPGRFQQADLIPSLTWLIGDRTCRAEWQGRFLGASPQPARYAINPDPQQRNRVSVLEGPSEYRMLLDGDDTRWLAAPPSAAAAAELLDHVNRERVSRMAEFRR